MILTKGQMIAGFPAITIRNLIREIRGYSVATEYVQDRLGISGKQAEDLVEKLVKEGYLSLDERGRHGDEKYYEVTSLGNGLANASAASPISREKADQILEELFQRAEAINADRSFTWGVKALIVFGSYMDPSKEKLGDVDVAMDLDRKPGLTPEDDEAQTRRDARAGKQFSSYFEQIAWQQIKIHKALKAGKRGLSLHSAQQDREILEKTPTKVFSFDL
jgi:DNA-binding PadR family transcriptional regulator